MGLVASRLAEERRRPAIVGADLGAVVRASCRSAGSLHLADALASCADLLLRHGGHAGAAGFEIETERWPAFRERFLALAAAAGPPDPVPSLPIDVALRARDVDYALHRDLQRLAPCGTGNPEPLVAVLGLTVTRAREADGGHSQLVLRRRLDVLDGIAFGWPELSREVAEGDVIDIVCAAAEPAVRRHRVAPARDPDAAPTGHHAEARAILDAAPVAVGPGPAVGLARPADVTRADPRPRAAPLRPRAAAASLSVPRRRCRSPASWSSPWSPSRCSAATCRTCPAPTAANGGPIRTPTPSNVVVVDPRADVPGSLLYVKDGNIWIQSGDQARQLTSGGQDSMPAWSPDGASIYFVRTHARGGPLAVGRRSRTYNLTVPRLVRIDADGTGEPEPSC